jgi:DNA-binding CsgD family transcriptional regulator
MVYDADALSCVIADLYEAALEPELWDGVAPRLARAFDASSAVLKTYRASGEVDLLEATDNVKQGPKDQALADHWHRNDLWVDRSKAYGPGRVIIGHELVPFSELEETGYYRDWLRLLAIHDVVGGVVDVGGGLGVLGIHRDRAEAAVAEGERRAAAVLLPHLERALRIRDRLSPMAHRATLAALEYSGLAVIVLTGSRRAVFVNAAADRILSDTRELSMTGGRLRAADPSTDLRLGAALVGALANAQGGRHRPPSGVALHRPGRGPLIALAVPLPERAGAHGEPGVLLLLRDPERSAPGAGLLRDLFGLTPSEAGVAAALCRGASVGAIAAEFHVGLSTVRTHLKNVMLKTNTKRQAELVALLLGARDTAGE